MAAPVTCKADEDPIKIEGIISWTVFFFVCLFVCFFQSRASNSEVDSPIWPEFGPIQDFMAVLVTCKIDEDSIKSEVAIIRTTFSPL